jgi:hypothetical protein
MTTAFKHNGMDSEIWVIYACPGAKLDILIEGLEKTCTAGLRYPIPQYMNYSPGFQTSFEKAAIARAGGTIEKK